MSWTRSLVVAVALMLIAGAGIMLRPSINSAAPSPHLNKNVPEQFGDWRTLPNPLIQADLSTDGATSTDQPYDEIVSRTYVNSRGDVVMMALAYGKNQRQEIKIHRPELCYPAQGFKVMSLKPAVFEGIHSAVNSTDVVGKRMTVHGKGHDEIVSYWIRIGDTFSASPWRIRWQIMQEGLQGRMTDGILVRLSQRTQPGVDPVAVHAMLENFARELVSSTPETTRSYLVR